MKLQLDDVADQQTIEAGWRSIEQRRARQVGRRRVLRTVAAVALVALLVVLGWALRPAPSLRPLRWAESVAAGSLPAGQHRLSDGSSIDLVGGSVASVLENSGQRLSLELTSGRVRFEVTPNTGRLWQVFVGETVVEVVGTIFTVDRNANRVRVGVERGLVAVRGPRVPGSEVRLSAGNHIELSMEDVSPVAEPTIQSPPVAPPPRRVVNPQRASRVPEILEPPQEPAVIVKEDLAALLKRADELRSEGRESEALTSLERIIDEYPAAVEAALAAFTLARIHEEKGRLEEATLWYRRAIELGLPEPLKKAAWRALDGEP